MNGSNSSRKIDTQTQNYRLKTVGPNTLKAIEPHYLNLPVDLYLNAPYRYRRLSRFGIQNGHIIELPHQPLSQTKESNRLLGGVVRTYEPIEKKLTSAVSFRALLLEFADTINLPLGLTDYRIHQMRVVTKNTQTGYPAPEGLHKDEALFAGILCIKRHLVEGGVTHLYNNTVSAPIFSKTLEEGDFLMINDQKLYHTTTEIYPIIEDKVGYRDVLVFTAHAMTAADREYVTRVSGATPLMTDHSQFIC